jgi:hypothetical protein
VALVNIDSALERCLRTLHRTKAPGGIEVLSYKRNRGVRVRKRPDGALEIAVRGYVREEMTVESSRAARVLGAVFRREFPRSRKVRIYLLDGPEPVPAKRKRL